MGSSVTNKFNFTLGYKCINKYDNIIKAERKNRILSSNNVIYKIGCKDCNAPYVGDKRRGN